MKKCSYDAVVLYLLEHRGGLQMIQDTIAECLRKELKKNNFCISIAVTDHERRTDNNRYWVTNTMKYGYEPDAEIIEQKELDVRKAILTLMNGDEWPGCFAGVIVGYDNSQPLAYFGVTAFGPEIDGRYLDTEIVERCINNVLMVLSTPELNIVVGNTNGDLIYRPRVIEESEAELLGFFKFKGLCMLQDALAKLLCNKLKADRFSISLALTNYGDDLEAAHFWVTDTRSYGDWEPDCIQLMAAEAAVKKAALECRYENENDPYDDIEDAKDGNGRRYFATVLEDDFNSTPFAVCGAVAFGPDVERECLGVTFVSEAISNVLQAFDPNDDSDSVASFSRQSIISNLKLSGFSIASDIEFDGSVCVNYARGNFIYAHQSNPYDDEEEMKFYDDSYDDEEMEEFCGG